MLAYRAAVHESTGKTSAGIIFDRDLRLPFDLRFGHPEERADTAEDFSLKLATRIDTIHDEARKKLQFESDKLKTRYDARSNNSGYQAGDEVLLYNPARKKGRSPKLKKTWEALILRGSTIWFIESNEDPERK
ncbi:hypothetical protein NQ317_005802 [Molorchus minor]|uniref:Uncharacterized protein n=1 Tax=Molorchus minor TaxID=1323400 RepID=A0ABQ9JLA4_9CUCU|nr:hypothetical protein NQ317_005802 [Molorchus minor]